MICKMKVKMYIFRKILWLKMDGLVKGVVGIQYWGVVFKASYVES